MQPVQSTQTSCDCGRICRRGIGICFAKTPPCCLASGSPQPQFAPPVALQHQLPARGNSAPLRVHVPADATSQNVTFSGGRNHRSTDDGIHTSQDSNLRSITGVSSSPVQPYHMPPSALRYVADFEPDFSNQAVRSSRDAAADTYMDEAPCFQQSGDFSRNAGRDGADMERISSHSRASSSASNSSSQSMLAHLTLVSHQSASPSAAVEAMMAVGASPDADTARHTSSIHYGSSQVNGVVHSHQSDSTSNSSSSSDTNPVASDPVADSSPWQRRPPPPISIVQQAAQAKHASDAARQRRIDWTEANFGSGDDYDTADQPSASATGRDAHRQAQGEDRPAADSEKREEEQPEGVQHKPFSSILQGSANSADSSSPAALHTNTSRSSSSRSRSEPLPPFPRAPTSSQAYPSSQISRQSQQQHTSQPPRQQQRQQESGDGVFRTPDGRRSVRLSDTTPVGASAAVVHKALGVEGAAVVGSIGHRPALKALKTLTLATIFLNQHGSSLDFVPYLVTDASAPNFLGVCPTYALHAFSRPLRDNETALLSHMRRAQHVFELSFSMRRSWQEKCAVHEDTAFHLADMLHAAVTTEQHVAAVAGAPRHGIVSSSSSSSSSMTGGASADDGGGIGSRSSDPINPGSRLPSASNVDDGDLPVQSRHQQHNQYPRHQQQRRHQHNAMPPQPKRPHYNPARSLYISVDVGQSLEVLAALALLERRLRAEGSDIMLLCSIYRNTVAPRLDGRDGFVFVINRGSVAADAEQQQWLQQQQRGRRRGARWGAESDRSGSVSDRSAPAAGARDRGQAQGLAAHQQRSGGNSSSAGGGGGGTFRSDGSGSGTEDTLVATGDQRSSDGGPGAQQHPNSQQQPLPPQQQQQQQQQQADSQGEHQLQRLSDSSAAGAPATSPAAPVPVTQSSASTSPSAAGVSQTIASTNATLANTSIYDTSLSARAARMQWLTPPAASHSTAAPAGSAPQQGAAGQASSQTTQHNCLQSQQQAVSGSGSEPAATDMGNAATAPSSQAPSAAAGGTAVGEAGTSGGAGDGGNVVGQPDSNPPLTLSELVRLHELKKPAPRKTYKKWKQ